MRDGNGCDSVLGQSRHEGVDGRRIERSDTGSTQDRFGESQFIQGVWITEYRGYVSATRGSRQCCCKLASTDISGNDGPPLILVYGGATRRGTDCHPSIQLGNSTGSSGDTSAHELR